MINFFSRWLSNVWNARHASNEHTANMLSVGHTLYLNLETNTQESAKDDVVVQHAKARHVFKKTLTN